MLTAQSAVAEILGMDMRTAVADTGLIDVAVAFAVIVTLSVVLVMTMVVVLAAAVVVVMVQTVDKTSRENCQDSYCVCSRDSGRDHCRVRVL